MKNLFENINFKDIRFTKMEEAEIKQIDKEKGIFEITISTNAVDRYSEVVDQNGMDMENYKKNPVVLWGHDYSLPPVGKSVEIKREDGRTKSQFKFADTQFARELRSLVEGGFLRTASIGFIPKEFDKESQTHTKWELLEWSLVTVPANPEALMNGAKELGCALVIKSLERMQEIENLKKIIEEKDKKIAELKDLNSLFEKQADKFDEKITAALENIKARQDKQGESEAQLIKIAGKAINAVLAERNKPNQ